MLLCCFPSYTIINSCAVLQANFELFQTRIMLNHIAYVFFFYIMFLIWSGQ